MEGAEPPPAVEAAAVPAELEVPAVEAAEAGAAEAAEGGAGALEAEAGSASAISAAGEALSDALREASEGAGEGGSAVGLTEEEAAAAAAAAEVAGGGAPGEGAEGEGAGEGAGAGAGEGEGAAPGAEDAAAEASPADAEAQALAEAEAAEAQVAAEAAALAAEAAEAEEAQRAAAEAAAVAAEEARLAAEEAAAAEATRVSLIASVRAAAEERAAALAANSALHLHLATWLALRAATAAAAAGGAAGGADAGASSASAPAPAPASDPHALEAELLPQELAALRGRVEDARSAFAKDRLRMERELAHYDAKAAELQAVLEKRETHLASVAEAFAAYKGEVARGAAHSVTGARIPGELLRRYLGEEAACDEAQARAELKHCAVSEAVRAARAEGGSGSGSGSGSGAPAPPASTGLDLDQLRSENSALAGSIEEREREVRVLAKKSAGAAQVLSHVREKLCKVRGEAAALEEGLGEVEGVLSAQRRALNAGKKAREGLAAANTAALRRQGFVFARAPVAGGAGGGLELAVDYERVSARVLEQRALLYSATGGAGSPGGRAGGAGRSGSH